MTLSKICTFCGTPLREGGDTETTISDTLMSCYITTLLESRTQKCFFSHKSWTSLMMRMLADLRWNDRQQHHNNTLLYPQLSRPFTQSWMKKLENTFSISALVNILGDYKFQIWIHLFIITFYHKNCNLYLFIHLFIYLYIYIRKPICLVRIWNIRLCSEDAQEACLTYSFSNGERIYWIYYVFIRYSYWNWYPSLSSFFMGWTGGYLGWTV